MRDSVTDSRDAVVGLTSESVTEEIVSNLELRCFGVV